MSLKTILKISLLVSIILLMVSPASASYTVIIYATHDGYVYETSPDAVFPVLSSGVGDAHVDNPPTYLYGGYTLAKTTTGIFDYHMRGGLTIPTGANIPDNAQITGAVLSVTGSNKYNADGTTDAELIDFAPVNDMDYANGDYSTTTKRSLANNITYAAWSSGWVNFTLTDFTVISKTGNTTLLLSHSADVRGGNLSDTWSSGGLSGFRYRSITYSSSTIPFITVVYSLSPETNFSGEPTSGNNPLTVTFTDLSTESPTSWYWDFGDGNSTNNTEQNPVHTYLAVGTYDVGLYTENAVGGDWENKTGYINVSGGVSPIITKAPRKTTTPHDYTNYIIYGGTLLVGGYFIYDDSVRKEKRRKKRT